MVTSLLPNGKQQFIDINGNPLVGGTVGMYIPNTLIFKNTWQDAAQMTLNTNPIILDSRGQALIYGTGTYRQIVKDAQGNLIWDEPTSGLGGGAGVISYVASIADLRALGTAGQANSPIYVEGYYSPNDGGGGLFIWVSGNSTADNGGTIINPTAHVGVGRWVRSYVAPVDALWFGAKGDGTTDNTTILSTWLAWCNSVFQSAKISQDPTVTSGNSNYKITGPLSAIILSFYMEPGTQLTPTGTGYTALTLQPQGYIESPWRIFIQGPGGAQTAASPLNGFYFRNPSGFVVEQIRCSDLNGFGMYLDQAQDAVFQLISIENCGNTNDYALTIGSSTADATNMTNFLHIQVELSTAKAIIINGDTLCCIFGSIHSERAYGDVLYKTWFLSGDNCTFINSRLNGDANCSAVVGGNGTRFTELRTEVMIPVEFITPSQTPFILDNPAITGACTWTGGNFGPCIIFGGYIASLKANNFVTGIRAYGTTFTQIYTATVTPGTGVTLQTRLYGCTVTGYVTNASYATLNDN